jgi:hypothetical protein
VVYTQGFHRSLYALHNIFITSRKFFVAIQQLSELRLKCDKNASLMFLDKLISQLSNCFMGTQGTSEKKNERSSYKTRANHIRIWLPYLPIV